MSLLESVKFSLFRNLATAGSTNIRVQRYCTTLQLAAPGHKRGGEAKGWSDDGGVLVGV